MMHKGEFWKDLAFWRGVMVWVKLSVTLVFCLFLILIVPALGFDTSDDLRHTISAISIFIIVFSVIYLAWMGSCRKLRLKRRGFWVAGLLNVLIGALVGHLTFPIVGFAFALFYAACAWQYASNKIEWLSANG